MDPNASELARELTGRNAREREAYYERTGVPTPLRDAVEAFFSGNSETVAPPDAGEPLSEITTRGAEPSVIGRYKVTRLLGRGGMGDVYLAHDPVLDRELAVKLIGAGIKDPNARRRLVDEARAAGRLRHPNIVTIFDAGEHEGNPYIAMEYVVGDTLRSLIERRAPFSQGRKLLLMEGACAGLAHAHRENVVHFDVKPDNLIVDGRVGVKVLDFGVARVLKSEALVTQHVAGTLRYMSPEQLTGKPLDRRSDVFSLGCSLFEFITYEPAYIGTAHEIITRITAGPVPRLSDVLPRVHPTLDALISKTMALDPAQRFDDLDELGRALRRFREQLDPIDEPWTTTRTTVDSPVLRQAMAPLVARPRRVTLAAVGILSALVIGSGALWIWKQDSTPQGQDPAASATREPAPQPSETVQQTPSPSRTETSAPPESPGPPTTSLQPPASSTAGSELRKAPNRAGNKASPGILTAQPPASARIPDDAGATRLPLPPARIEPPPPIAPPTPAVDTTATTKPEPVLPSTTVAAPIDENKEVLAALGRYRDAFATLDVSAVQRIYPTLAASQVEQLRRSFESTTTYEIALTQPRVDVRTNTATVRMLVTRRIVPRVGNPQSSAVETEFRLQRGAHGWTITDVKANP